ncbi:Hypothetical protein KNT65_gp151 [Escherichia phage EcS1]|uniref:Uncharacterized protein n=1 Tax=Escherichia phage EcS1 TaxID=2083276 RepID=A0A2Z5ZD09_9CAUD|nr:Hypothetical protein KNT65_gp151 [Escherichia phage EcS1]BBC78342.1 Hypothetical protein [Escherichia phage EcS1]
MFAPYQQRVVEERDELNIKVRALMTFVASAAFDNVNPQERIRMQLQLDAMQAYENCLDDRIANF